MAEGSGEALFDATGWPTAAEPDAGLDVAPAAPGVPGLINGTADLGVGLQDPDPVLYVIQLWFTPLLVTLGSLGNCLCVVVFFGTKLKKLSSSYYLSALAISDTCCLMALAAPWFDFIDIAVFNKNGFCQLFVYIKYVCSFLSVWFVVAFTVERFVAVSYPLQRLSVCTVARARAVLVTLTVVGLGLYSPYLFISAVVPHAGPPGAPGATPGPAQYVCDLLGEWRHLANLLNYADICLTLVLPVLLILSLNACIARTVWRLARARRDLTNAAVPPHATQALNGSTRSGGRRAGRRTLLHHRGSTRPGSSQAKVTEMLLVVSTVFIALNLPSYIIRLWVFVNETVQSEDRHMIIILQNYFNVLFDANFGINFVLYCVSGQNFRRALVGMCGFRTRRSDTTILTVVSECQRTGSINRNRTTTVSSWRDIHRGSQELLSLAKDRDWNGYHHTEDAEKTHL